MFSNTLYCDDTLGGRISLAREATGFSVEEAARRLGVLSSSWAAWECDRDVPRSNKLTMMAGVLSVSPSWLLSGLGDGPVEQTAHNDSGGLQQVISKMSEDIETLNRRVLQLTLRLEREVNTSA